MGSQGAVGKGGGGKENGNPGKPVPGAGAAVEVSAADDVSWLLPGKTHTQTNKNKNLRIDDDEIKPQAW